MSRKGIIMHISQMTNNGILIEIGERIQRVRLNQNITQNNLAERAGVSRKMVQSLENGNGCTLNGFICILRGLGVLDQIDTFLPEPGISPIQLAKLEGTARQRATGKRIKKDN